jgi:hypothetical protein
MSLTKELLVWYWCLDENCRAQKPLGGNSRRRPVQRIGDAPVPGSSIAQIAHRQYPPVPFRLCIESLHADWHEGERWL